MSLGQDRPGLLFTVSSTNLEFWVKTKLGHMSPKVRIVFTGPLKDNFLEAITFNPFIGF